MKNLDVAFIPAHDAFKILPNSKYMLYVHPHSDREINFVMFVDEIH